MSVAMKCFETLDSLHFPYCPNRSSEDAISFALHSALSHLDKRSTYVRMLLIDYSSGFNTTVPTKLITKLRTLGLITSLCNWILDFLKGQSQVVSVDNNTPATVILNTGSPQRCVLRPLLYSLYTHDCVAIHDPNTIIKFSCDTSVIGLITMTMSCQDNNFSLNVSKTKALIVYYRKRRAEHASILIDGL